MLLCIALTAAGAFAATATGPDGLDDEEVTAFLARLQDAVRADDPKAVAALLHFPLRVNYAPRRGRGAATTVRVTTAERFVRDYARIVTPRVKSAVLEQPPDKLFRNAQGVMIGDGEVWYAGACQDRRCRAMRVGVIAINVGP